MPSNNMRKPDEIETADGDSSFLLKSIDGEDSDAKDDELAIVESQDLELDALQGKEDNEGGLGRHLGLYSTTLLIISRMVGTGIFSTPSSIITGVGSVGAALILWILGFGISFCGLFVWLEYGCLFPRGGGEKVYLEAAYPRPRYLATTLFSVQAVLLSSAAGGCIVFAENVVLASGYNGNDFTKRIIAILAILYVTLTHSFIPKSGVRINDILGTVKILILVFIVLTGLFLLTIGIATVPNPGASFKDPFVGSSRSSYDYALALFKVIATYAGWSNASYVLNEVKNPVRTLKIAGPLGLGVVGLLYGLANVAFFAAATPQEIGESGVTVAALFLGKVFGEGARRVAGVFVATSALGNIMTVSFSLSRVDQELAKEGMLPFSRFWASNWPSGSPSAALFLVFFYTSFIIVAVPFGDAYNFILDVMGYPFAFTSLMVTIGLFILRRRAYHLARSFKIWLPLAFFFLATQVFLIVTPFIRPANGKGDTSLPYWLPPVVGIICVLGGLLYWAVWRVGLPLLGGFSWVTQETHLQDGTTVIVWARSKSSVLRKKNRFW